MGSERKAAALDAREAQDVFVRENLRRIFGVIYRIVGNVADAQDLTQETFIKAFERAEQLKDPKKASQWLGRVATNTALDFLRRKGRVSFAELEPNQDFLEAEAFRRPDAQLLDSERNTKLEQCLDALSERERTALVLRDVEDLPAKEVAKVLGCSSATVRSHIANARVKFRALYAKLEGAR
ncbi:MAG: sigma-70 family RNA polymerase sigma factor [Bryobacter sp.]|nr:sigma-70 family RNA polymerase sigma factor [Bryobacter sp.]